MTQKSNVDFVAPTELQEKKEPTTPTTKKQEFIKEKKVAAKETSTKQTIKKDTKKNKGGRPKKPKDQLRKQYTLTLRPETYQLIMSKASEENLSFAKYVERAVLDYISKK